MSRKTYKQIITSPEKTELFNEKNKQLIKSFLREKDTRSSSETVSGYASDLNIFFSFVLENLDNKFFVDIKKSEFSQFFSFCVSDLKWGSARFNRMRSCLSSLSNYIERVMDDEFPLYRNMILKAVETMPRVASREKTVLSEDQINKLLAFLSNEGRTQECALLTLAIGSGARISELLRFNIDIIDPENTAYDGLFIESSKMIKTKGRTKMGDLKYKYIIKSLFMPYYEKWLVDRKKIMEEHKQDHNHIFIKSDGTPASVETIRYWITLWEKILGVDIYAHAFRHYCVTFLTRAGLPSELVISLMGWKSPSMFLIYNDVSDKEREWKELSKLKDHLEKQDEVK